MEKKVTKEDYLRKKGLLPQQNYGEMYTFTSNREGVGEIRKILIWDKSTSTGTRGSFDTHQSFEIVNYKFKEAPYEASFWEGAIVSEDRGCGSGFGDLWSWTTFCSLDENALIGARITEHNRIKEKYLNVIDKGLELERIINDFSWIKVKSFKPEYYDKLGYEAMYYALDEHHRIETEFLINKCRELAKELIEERAKPKEFYGRP